MFLLYQINMRVWVEVLEWYSLSTEISMNNNGYNNSPFNNSKLEFYTYTHPLTQKIF